MSMQFPVRSHAPAGPGPASPRRVSRPLPARPWRTAVAALLAGSLLWLSACGGGGEFGADTGLPVPPPAAPEPPPSPQGPLTGDANASAKSAIQDVDSGDSYSPAEVSVDPDGGRVVRTKIEILFRDAATVGQANALLAGIGARITSSIAGQRWVVVRIPDPGTLDALDALVARIEAEPFVWFVRRSVLPDTSELPENVAADAAEGVNLRHHLAVGAAGAWAARNAIVDFPRVIVVDFFGDGPPNGELDYNYVGSAATDFATGALESHGYHVAGIIAGKFGGPATPRGRVTGMMPGLVQLSVVDLQKRDPLDMQARLLMQLRSVASGTVVVNTSLGWNCNTRTTCLPIERVRLEAVSWIEKVRTAGLEGRFLHVTAAGNFVGREAELGVRDARYGYFSGAASLLTDLVDAAGNPVAPLTNVLMVENVRAVAEFPFAGPRCVSDRSYEGGHVGGIGAHVWSFTDAGSGSDFDSGTSMAAPQVAGLAAYLLAIRPELTPQDLVKILRDTAAPVPVETDPDCSSAAEPAPIIQAHAALLALDRPGEGLGQLPVRLALLDIDGNGAYTEADLQEFLRSFETAQGAVDFGRADLNNDGRTGGDTTRPFDLDADRVIESGGVSVPILGEEQLFNESRLTDLEIVCYYAHSGMFTGDAVARDNLLAPYRQRGECGRVLVSVESAHARTRGECSVRADGAGGGGVPGPTSEDFSSGETSPVTCDAVAGGAAAQVRLDFGVDAPALVPGEGLPGNGLAVRSFVAEEASVAPSSYDERVEYPAVAQQRNAAFTEFSARLVVGEVPVTMVADALPEGTSDDDEFYSQLQMAYVSVEILDASGARVEWLQARWMSRDVVIENDICPSCPGRIDARRRLEPGWTVVVTGQISVGTQLQSVYTAIGVASSDRNRLAYSLDLGFEPI